MWINIKRESTTSRVTKKDWTINKKSAIDHEGTKYINTFTSTIISSFTHFLLYLLVFQSFSASTTRFKESCLTCYNASPHLLEYLYAYNIYSSFFCLICRSITQLSRPARLQSWKSDAIDTPIFYSTMTTVHRNSRLSFVGSSPEDILRSARSFAARNAQLAHAEIPAHMACSHVSGLRNR